MANQRPIAAPTIATERDELTGLPHGQALHRDLAAGAPGTLLEIRIDDLGAHDDDVDAADRTVAAVARRVRAVLRPCDVVVRLDRARFLALVRDRPPIDPLAVAEQLAVAAAQPIHRRDGSRLPTVSLAIAVRAAAPEPTGAARP